MQEKKIHQKIQRERERERGNLFFLVRENYAQNKRDNDKFIVRGCELEESKINEDEEKEKE